MRPRRFTAWHKVAALAPLLLLAVTVPGQSLFRCRMDGLLRSTSCCPADAATDGQSASAPPVVKAQDCCDREATSIQRPVMEPARTALADAAWAVAPAVAPGPVSLGLGESDRAERAWQAHGPPREGRPLVLVKHAFLI